MFGALLHDPETEQPNDGTPGERAVSPVIGVILMVAITVILAAVIGAFVLEIGDQQETAPNTSFDTEQRSVYIVHACDHRRRNETVVSVSHAGGGVLSHDQTHVKVNGGEMALHLEAPRNDNGCQSGSNPKSMELQTAPNLVESAGTNEKITFQSGNSWDVVTRGSVGDNVAKNGVGHAIKREHAYNYGQTLVGNIPWNAYNFDPGKDGNPIQVIARPNQIPSSQDSNSGYDDYYYEMLQNGDDVQVVWTASSGGKTQTLFRYTVQ
jgi:flagellin-like protein